jgi:hypothetical protein
MGGNGAFIPHNGSVIQGQAGLADIVLIAGLGSGCVTTGPFKSMSVNLGPVSLSGSATGPLGGLGYNPRCLKRDVGPGVAAKYTNANLVTSTLLPSTPTMMGNRLTISRLDPRQQEHQRFPTRHARCSWLWNHWCSRWWSLHH